MLCVVQRYSAESLRSITTEVLKVLNATEELLQGVEGGDSGLSSISLPPNADPQKLDQQFSRLEENVRSPVFPLSPDHGRVWPVMLVMIFMV